MLVDQDDLSGNFDAECGGAWGMEFVLVFLVGGAAYVAGGVVYGRRTKGGSGPPLEAHPHFEKWQAFRSLTMDGVAFSRARLQGRSGGGSRGSVYERVPEGGGEGDRSGRSERVPEEKKTSKSSKGSKGSKSSGKDSGKQSKESKEGKESSPKKSKSSGKGKPKSGGGGAGAQEAAEEETAEEEKERMLQEERSGAGHSSQQKIKVVGLNS